MTQPPGRRTTDLDEVKRAALAQIAEGGVQSLSLNAIARSLGLTGPALYRYVAGRDELVTLLLSDAYAEFATALASAAEGHREPAPRLRAVGQAYRAWALDHPERYDLLFGTPLPDYEAPEAATRESAQRGLGVLVAVFAQHLDVDPTHPAALDGAVRAWARAHGLVSLELQGHLADLPVDPADLFARDVESLLVD